MIFNTNKERGNAGLALAIAYYGANGYIVSLPLNDTQDYDLIVDKDNKLQRIQVKATQQQSKHGIYLVSVRSCGGTTGKPYKWVKDTDIDFLFVVCSNGDLYEIPKSYITQSTTINLGQNCQNYKVKI